MERKVDKGTYFNAVAFRNEINSYSQPKSYISMYVVQFQRSISENSLVAMDFSGQKSRVIENPSEALSVAVEEGLSWRVSPLIKLYIPEKQQ